jgi:hypothetical protein
VVTRSDGSWEPGNLGKNVFGNEKNSDSKRITKHQLTWPDTRKVHNVCSCHCFHACSKFFHLPLFRDFSASSFSTGLHGVCVKRVTRHLILSSSSFQQRPQEELAMPGMQFERSTQLAHA